MAVSADTATVEFDSRPACHACSTGLGCGLGPVLALFVGRGTRRVDVPNRPAAPYRVGERVRITISAGRMAALVAAAYGIPLMAVVMGAATATVLVPGNGDAPAVAGAGVGAAGAWAWLRFGGIGVVVGRTFQAGRPARL